MSSKAIERFIDKTIREKDEICRDVLKRIQKEKSNFEKIVSKIPITYTSMDHQKAVEVYSWSLLKEGLEKLYVSGYYTILTRKALRAIDDKDAEAVLYCLNKIERKMKNYK